jgi:hypothetical protein
MLKRITLFFTIFLFLIINAFAQTNYKGYIDKYPIELITDIYSDMDVRAIYTYQKYNDPIVINGKKTKGNLVLFEKDKQGKISASLTFQNFDTKKKILTGIWKNVNTKQELPINLEKEFTIEYGDSISFPDREILQPVSLNEFYFKLVISKDKAEFSSRVTAVKILQKKTDSLIQLISLECQNIGLNSIEINDYNFDGIKEFSVFEASYSGPNTSRVYFLYNTKTKQFVDAAFRGVCLDFNPKTKRVIEHNQCCAGRQQTRTEYKIVNDKMVLLEEHCYIWSDKKKDLVERKMKDCQ